MSYFIDLFQNMSLLTSLLIGMGVLLCIVEVFVPKIGFTGIFGVVMIAAGLSSYYIDGFKPSQLVVMILIIALFLAVFILVGLVLEAKGVIKNPHKFKFRTYGQVNLNELVGKNARAITNIDLGGTIDIEGKLYYAVTDYPISKGSIVTVVGVNNNSLVVK